MSFLDSALELAANGYRVFPLIPNGKTPWIKNFTEEATTDVEKIKDWWIEPIMEFEKDFNIGIATSGYDDYQLIAIDVDDKNGKEGSKELEKIDLIHEVPSTFVQITASGGKHLIYKTPVAVKQGADVLAKGLDIRSKGGYVVGIGSMIDGRPYHGPITLPSEAPQWLIDICGKAPEKKKADVAIVDINEDAAKTRAIDYLENHAPLSVEGSSGDQTAYVVACRLKDIGIGDGIALELMLDHWNDRCSPPWDEEGLEKKILNAYLYGNEAVGASAPEAQFERITHEPSEESLSYLQKMNKEYALVYMEGSHFILHETIDEKGAPKRTFLTEQTFKRRFSPYSVQKKTTYAQEWLDWKNRREYSGVCFAPEREARNGYYNLWRGFTIAPLAYEAASDEQRRGFDNFIGHTRENICQGDERLFTWLIGYFAHLVQKPCERPLTTLVFRGSKGTGKNAFIDRIGAILGRGHYLVAHDGRYLTSNFNAHFDSCLCLVLDEAFWSGDKSAEGKLKGITTSPEIMIERKGKEPYVVDNLTRIIIIGNEDWLVPASTDERRYAVCDVGNGKKQNRKFFHEMRVLMDDKGGNRILLDYLKNFDLSKVDVNEAPQTQALLEQKTSSLEPFENFWFNCLKEGKLLNSEFGDMWPELVDTHSFRSAFMRTTRDLNIRSRLLDDVALGMRFRRMSPGVAKTKRREGDRTVNVYKFPTLIEARLDWDAFIGQASKWE